ncbi:uncharacterized protein LOC126653769 [Mercurialis annua]|uniref:uncharacterized protein LOC126653769 n=1 Tax=Mercurialis annua TaxID=3986 RepID=UPI002160311D|nr:uncharacterized protein LOC126653769 [Mercurialis annua]
MMAVDLQNWNSLLLPSQHFNESNDHNSSSSSSIFSGFGSPVESELGFTESESDQEDDYIAELTRQMTHSMLQDDDEKEVIGKEEELGIEKTENLKQNEEKNVYNEEIFLGNSLEPNSVNKPKIPNLEFQSRQALIDYQIRTVQLHKLKQEEFMKQQQIANKQYELNKQQNEQFSPNKQRACNGEKQRTGSEMTAVFLGEPGSRSGSSGTGVFFPRGISNPCESPKKQGNYSTVLIPARVVQALKLQFDKMGIESRPNGAHFAIQLQQHDGKMEDVRYSLGIKKENQSKNVKTMNNQEMNLPHEWTY